MKWTPRDARGLDDVLIAMSDGREVYAPVRGANGSFRLSKSDGWRTGSHTLGDFRQTEPLKTLFFPAREFIGRWKSGVPKEPMPERIVFGVKNCDLSALSVFDHVFLHGVAEDTYYAEARKKTILVSSDCADHRDVCFCPAMGEHPWAEQGFDINISETPEGALIEDGSERGAALGSTLEATTHIPAQVSLIIISINCGLISFVIKLASPSPDKENIPVFFISCLYV